MATRRKTGTRKTTVRKTAKQRTTGAKKARPKKAKKTARKGGKKPARRKTATAAVTAVKAFRLAPDVRPHTTAIKVEVDPARSSAFAGEVAIDLTLDRRRRSIELHCADLRVSRARLHANGALHRGRVTLHPERETVTVAFDRLLPAGEARLELAFAGRLRKDLSGLYAVRVGERQFAFTQLEASDARKFFPCFDEPAMKSRFSLEVTTGSGNEVVSNGRVVRSESLGDGRKTVHFAPTPPLSSYLVALAVGELERSEPTFAGDTEIRVWHVPGKGALTGFALEAARETLIRLEAWFGLPYPYGKLDLVAVPDFEFGAMENAGAVFFRETLLLMEPATVTLAEKKRAAEVICHELAHMWYGDLVTMAWWDDLWLNEAFATWMAFEIVNEWKPEWKMWQDFQSHRAAAFDLDCLRNTHPIYTPVRTPQEADANFDAITYEKGASVVRMIERYLGPEKFRQGVQLYIRRHRESNTVAADLWRALSEASGEKIEPMVRTWIEQEGYPVVTIRRVEGDDGAQIELRQERFLERAAPPRSGAKPRWQVPWVGRVGTGTGDHTRLVRHLLTSARARIPAQGADLTFVYGNADEGGFFRPQHSDDDLRDIANDLRCLSAVERMGWVDHQWALVRAGRATIASLLDIAASLGAETDADVLAAVSKPLALLVKRLAPDAAPESVERLRGWIEVYYGGQVDDLGWDPGPDESDANRLRRAAILGIVGGLARASAVLKTADERCRAYLADRSSLDPNLSDVVASIAALEGDEPLYDGYLEAVRAARTPQEHRRFLLALGDFENSALIDRTLTLSLSDEVASQDVASLLARLLANPAAREQTWEIMKRRWKRLQRRVPPLLLGRLIESTPALGTRPHRREVAAFFRENPVPVAFRSLRQALERFDWYAEFKLRATPELVRYLQG